MWQCEININQRVASHFAVPAVPEYFTAKKMRLSSFSCAHEEVQYASIPLSITDAIVYLLFVKNSLVISYSLTTQSCNYDSYLVL